MLSLLRLFWPLCQLKHGPQDLPANPALLRTAILLCLVGGVLVFSVSLPFTDALLRASVSLMISLFMWPLVLRLLGRQARTVQTLTAIFGCAAVLNFLLWPLLLLLTALGDKASLLPLLALGLAIWSQVINGHILRHTLEWPLARALALALVLFALRYGVYRFIFN